jgi:hypothetical protein
LLIKAVWLLPVKVMMLIVDNNEKLQRFFEATCSTGDSWGAGFFSFFAWIAAFILAVFVIASLDDYRNTPPESPPTTF